MKEIQSDGAIKHWKRSSIGKVIKNLKKGNDIKRQTIHHIL